MAYLHNDREQFKDAIYLAYDQTGIMVQAIEKDYYVTMLLKLLSEKIHQNKTHPGAWNCRFHQGWERGEIHHAGISSNQ